MNEKASVTERRRVCIVLDFLHIPCSCLISSPVVSDIFSCWPLGWKSNSLDHYLLFTKVTFIHLSGYIQNLVSKQPSFALLG